MALIDGGRDTSSPPERAEKREGIEELGQEQTEATKEESGRYDAVATVAAVVDGDTVEVDPTIDGEEDVRLIGVDTPETIDSDEGIEPYGEEAANFSRSVLEGEKSSWSSTPRKRTSPGDF